MHQARGVDDGLRDGGASPDWTARLRQWARELEFSQIAVSGIDMSAAESGLLAWLAEGCHGGMDYMARHGLMRARPAELVPGTLSVISVRMDYLPHDTPADWRVRELARLERPDEAVISLYARGRDYHKVLRQRLQQLGERLLQAAREAGLGEVACRPFTDSAPVLEVAHATRGGLGWRGKHTLALARQGGSMFFLGELFTSLALPATPPVPAHCGQCSACIDVCPTRAIVAPQRLDARRCISYLTIEHDGPIPLEFRAAMGNRIYGCDDCQLVCPWNKYAQRSALPDFDVRPGMAGSPLLALWAWDEATFLRRTEGNAIRRIGHARWRRNLAVALGNALRAAVARGDAAAARAIRSALSAARPAASPLLAEHLGWALAQGDEAASPGSA